MAVKFKHGLVEESVGVDTLNCFIRAVVMYKHGTPEEFKIEFQKLVNCIIDVYKESQGG